MRSLVISILLIIGPSLGYASIAAKVVKLKGTVVLNQKNLKQGDLIKSKGRIKTSKDSYVVLKFLLTTVRFTIGPNSEVELASELKGTGQELRILSGASRWLSKGRLDNAPHLKTPNASMGVRGTDFLTTFNPLLGESEIVIFDGHVLFQNRHRVGDRKILKKGQWGGLGGRFGEKIGAVLSLPPNVLTYFDTQLNP